MFFYMYLLKFTYWFVSLKWLYLILCMYLDWIGVCIWMSFMHLCVEKLSCDQFVISYGIFPAGKLGTEFMDFFGGGGEEIV